MQVELKSQFQSELASTQKAFNDALANKLSDEDLTPLRNRLSKQQEELDKLSRDGAVSKKNYTELSSQVDTLAANFGNHVSDFNLLTETFAQHESRVDGIEDYLLKKIENNEIVTKAELAAMRDQVKAVETKHEALKEKSNAQGKTFISRKQDIDIKLASINQTLGQQEIRTNNLQEMLATNTSRINDLRDKVDANKDYTDAELKNLRGEYKAVKSQVKKDSERHGEQYSSLSRTLETKLDGVFSTLERHENRALEFEKVLSATTSRIGEVQTDLISRIKLSEGRIDELDGLFDGIKSKTKNLMLEITKARTESGGRYDKLDKKLTDKFNAFKVEVDIQMTAKIEASTNKLMAEFGQSINTSEFRALQSQNAELASELKRIASQTSINTSSIDTMKNSVSDMSSTVANVKKQLQALESNGHCITYCRLLRRIEELESEVGTLRGCATKAYEAHAYIKEVWITKT